MDRLTRKAILKSFARGVRLNALVDGDGPILVSVDRDEFKLLLDEHAFICGLALGASPVDEQRESQGERHE
jgi:hypothetical protein